MRLINVGKKLNLILKKFMLKSEPPSIRISKLKLEVEKILKRLTPCLKEFVNH